MKFELIPNFQEAVLFSGVIVHPDELTCSEGKDGNERQTEGE